MLSRYGRAPDAMFFSTPLDALSSPVKYTTSRPLPVAPLVLGSGDAFIHKLSPSSFGIGRGVRKALANFTPYNTVTKDLTAEQSGPRSPSLDQATMDSNVVSRGDFGRVRQSGPSRRKGVVGGLVPASTSSSRTFVNERGASQSQDSFPPPSHTTLDL